MAISLLLDYVEQKMKTLFLVKSNQLSIERSKNSIGLVVTEIRYSQLRSIIPSA